MVTVNKLPTASQKLQLLEQLIAKLLDFDRCSNLSNIDEGVRKIAAHQIIASDLNTFTNTFLFNMRMKFVTTTTWSLMMSWSVWRDFSDCVKEKQNNITTSPWEQLDIRAYLVGEQCSGICRKSYELRRQQSRHWPVDSLLTLRGIEWSHVWWQLMDLECFSCFLQVSASSSLVGEWQRCCPSSLRIDTWPDDDFLCFSVSSFVVHPAVFLVISWSVHVHSCGWHISASRHRPLKTSITPCSSHTHMSHRSWLVVLWKTLRKWCPVLHVFSLFFLFSFFLSFSLPPLFSPLFFSPSLFFLPPPLFFLLPSFFFSLLLTLFSLLLPFRSSSPPSLLPALSSLALSFSLSCSLFLSFLLSLFLFFLLSLFLFFLLSLSLLLALSLSSSCSLFLSFLLSLLLLAPFLLVLFLVLFFMFFCSCSFVREATELQEDAAIPRESTDVLWMNMPGPKASTTATVRWERPCRQRPGPHTARRAVWRTARAMKWSICARPPAQGGQRVSAPASGHGEFFFSSKKITALSVKLNKSHVPSTNKILRWFIK